MATQTDLVTTTECWRGERDLRIEVDSKVSSLGLMPYATRYYVDDVRVPFAVFREQVRDDV